MPIIQSLEKEGKISKSNYIVCNGHKRPQYLQYISEMLNDGFENLIPVLDNWDEIDYYLQHATESKEVQVGIRIATDEEPNFAFYTSRLGIRYKDIDELYLQKIKPNPRFKLKMLHFFINSGIKDTAYYWSELTRFMFKYCELKKNMSRA